jgi:hypothetical protein
MPLPEVRAAPGVQEVRHVAAPPVVDRHRLRRPRLHHGRDDFPQIVHSPPLVLRLLPDDQHSRRDLRKHLEREIGATCKTAGGCSTRSAPS